MQCQSRSVRSSSVWYRVVAAEVFARVKANLLQRLSQDPLVHLSVPNLTSMGFRAILSTAVSLKASRLGSRNGWSDRNVVLFTLLIHFVIPDHCCVRA